MSGGEAAEGEGGSSAGARRGTAPGGGAAGGGGGGGGGAAAARRADGEARGPREEAGRGVAAARGGAAARRALDADRAHFAVRRKEREHVRLGHGGRQRADVQLRLHPLLEPVGELDDERLRARAEHRLLVELVDGRACRGLAAEGDKAAALRRAALLVVDDGDVLDLAERLEGRPQLLGGERERHLRGSVGEVGGGGGGDAGNRRRRRRGAARRSSSWIGALRGSSSAARGSTRTDLAHEELVGGEHLRHPPFAAIPIAHRVGRSERVKNGCAILDKRRVSRPRVGAPSCAL